MQIVNLVLFKKRYHGSIQFHVVSPGLTYSQCARLLGEKGCIFGVPLDGGGSSTMVFQGKVLNSAKAGQRSVVDFVYFK